MTVTVIIIILISLIIMPTSSIMFIKRKSCMFYVFETGYNMVLIWLHDNCFVMIYIFNFAASKVQIRTAKSGSSAELIN